MDDQIADPTSRGTTRIMSIDILRGLTILVMIFVNDLAGVANVPAWMKHAATLHDGMTFVDWVFPGFLFIVGMSIPFSIGRRIENGESMLSVWKHILIRVAGLLVLGVYMVNGEVISNQGILNPNLWILLMYIFVIVIWNRNSNPGYFLSKRWVKYLAGLGLVALIFLYRGGDQTGVIQMRHYWWGILGLIGWGYLVTCLIYIPLRRNQQALLGSIVLLYAFYCAVEAGMLRGLPLVENLMSVGSTLGSHPGIMLSGVVLGGKIRENLESDGQAGILGWAFGFSIFLLLAGLFLHQLNRLDNMFIVSKNLATVPWCLLSSTFTVWIWMLIYWLVDVKGLRSWSRIMEPAGMNPLFAYILAPLVVECFAVAAAAFHGMDPYDWLGRTFYIGFARALLIALLMTWLPGYLGKKGLQLKL